MVGDGAMGAQLRAADLSLDDVNDLEGTAVAKRVLVDGGDQLGVRTSIG
jgi:hypothetical protein